MSAKLRCETRRHDSAGDAEAEVIRDESLERTVE
jgi:hypothetical protein